MTATFGKLENDTLRLAPGLNILEAPNEWGKSTWCAFLCAMLYGLDTRAKTTKAALADKEHFAPWSGRPMSGRMDIYWNGRDITLERTTKGRVPMGTFRAYETETGLDIPELDGQNCGQMLLGMERSVFLRSCFIRFSDLPVTDDEALRRRLNALVTTGDESGRSEKLASDLKELKNRIRYHRSGLLPQAQQQRDQLRDKLEELEKLSSQQTEIVGRMEALRDRQRLLENHEAALNYQTAREHEAYIAQARQIREEAGQELARWDAQCAAYPSADTVRQVLAEIDRLADMQQDMERELAQLPEIAPPEELFGIFGGMEPEEALEAAAADRKRHWVLSERHYGVLLLGILLGALGGAAAFAYRLPGLICAGVGMVLLAGDVLVRIIRRREKKRLEDRYGGQIADLWVRGAQRYAAARAEFDAQKRKNAALRQELEQQLRELQENVEIATEGRGLDACRQEWQYALLTWQQQESARLALERAEDRYRTLSQGSQAGAAEPPQFPDTMDYSHGQTREMLDRCARERQQLENQLGQFQGKAEALGERESLMRQLRETEDRIDRLEQTYDAVLLAQENLSEATARLQRRFAPRIAGYAGELLGRLTQSRYDRLKLSADLSVRAGTRQEDTLREILWRSDGTVDQLYLALRLAVAKELAPDAPLILDDALVRFDDERLKAALEILEEEAQSRQVLLFTCHGREKSVLNQKG